MWFISKKQNGALSSLAGWQRIALAVLAWWIAVRSGRSERRLQIALLIVVLPFGFAFGLLQAALILRHRAVRAAVDQLAATLLASSAGRAKGRTVEAICTDLGIFPLRVLDHERPPVLRPTMSVRPRHLRMKVRTR